MVAIKGRFNGKVIVPEEPVALPENQRVLVRIEPIAEENVPTGSVLDWIVAHPISDDSLPADLAHQHDHYLYGTPKKER